MLVGAVAGLLGLASVRTAESILCFSTTLIRVRSR